MSKRETTGLGAQPNETSFKIRSHCLEGGVEIEKGATLAGCHVFHFLYRDGESCNCN